MTEPLLTCREVASLIGFSSSTVQDWIERGEGPPCFRIGGRLRFRLAEVEAWVESRRVGDRTLGGTRPREDRPRPDTPRQPISPTGVGHPDLYDLARRGTFRSDRHARLLEEDTFWFRDEPHPDGDEHDRWRFELALVIAAYRASSSTAERRLFARMFHWAVRGDWGAWDDFFGGRDIRWFWRPGRLWFERGPVT